MREKFRLIFVPFLWINIGCVLIYTFLNWLLFIHWQAGPVKEEIRDLWVPFILPSIPLVIWLRPRLQLLKFREKAKNPVFGCILLAAFAIAPPVIVAQAYLETATGELTHVNRIEEIGNLKPTRYYSADHYFIDTLHTGSWFTRTVAGKSGSSLDLDLYIVCPVYSDSDEALPNGPGGVKIGAINQAAGVTDTGSFVAVPLSDSIVVDQPHSDPQYSDLPHADPSQQEAPHSEAMSPQRHSYRQPIAWIAAKFHKQISNRSKGEEKMEKIMAFKSNSWADFRMRPLSGFAYFERAVYSDEYVGYRGALGVLLQEKASGTQTIFLKPSSAPFEARNGHKLFWIFGAFLIGAAIWSLILWFTPLKIPVPEEAADDHPVIRHTRFDPGDVKKNIKEWTFPFVPKPRFFITPLIVDLNIFIYLLMAVSGLGWFDFHSSDLVEWGANWGPYTSGRGQWWRLLTSVFVHGGLLHIFMNMFGLLLVGIFLEPVLGRRKYVFAYLGTGILASLASLTMHPQVVSVGASGAIFGLYGIMIAFLLRGVFPPSFKKAFLASILFFVGYNLVLGHLQEGIDNAAHAGGLVSGFLAGLLLKPERGVKESGTKSVAEDGSATGSAYAPEKAADGAD